MKYVENKNICYAVRTHFESSKNSQKTSCAGRDLLSCVRSRYFADHLYLTPYGSLLFTLLLHFTVNKFFVNYLYIWKFGL